MREVSAHGFSGVVQPGVPFTDASQILKLDAVEPATLLAVESPTQAGELEQLGFMVAGPGRTASNATGILEGWPATRPWMPHAPLDGEGAAIAPYDNPASDGPRGTLLLVGYQLPAGTDIAVRPEMLVRYEADGGTYEGRREARMVVCNAEEFSAPECARKAGELFPEG